MRTFDEIMDNVQTAGMIKDNTVLLTLTQELDTLGTPEAEGASLKIRGNVAVNTGDYPKALENYGRALRVYEEMDDPVGAAGVTTNMGTVYLETGDYPQALEHYQRALQAGEVLGHRSIVANCTGSIGIVYYTIGEFEQALEHFTRAVKFHEELGQYAGAARMTGNMGNVYLLTGEHEQALECLRRALQSHEKLGNHAGVAHVTSNLASALLAMNRDDEAAALLEKLSSMMMDGPTMRAEYYTNQAVLAEHKGNLDQALEHMQQALQLATEVGLRGDEARFHQGLRNLAQKRNDFEGYVKHNNEYQRITEETNGKDTATKLAMQEAQRVIDQERKEHEKHLAVLHATLPKHIADRVARGETVSDHFENAAVLFLDVAGFTTHSADLPSDVVTALLARIFQTFDAICKEHGVTKVKTIGDAYLCFAHSGNGERGTDIGERISDIGPEERIAAVALAMQQAEFYWPSATADSNSNRVQFRIGLHSGPLTAGVIGTERLQYDIWGDTVNVASRMESTGEAGRIQVSEAFASALCQDVPGALCLVPSVTSEHNQAPGTGHPALRERGALEIKGKGTMKTYWLENTKE